MQSPELARHLRWLKKAFPLDHRVYVKEKPRRDIDGRTDGWQCWTGKSFVIYICESLSWVAKNDTLNHEWAHVRVKHMPDAAGEISHHLLWQAESGRISAAYEFRKGNP